jgi:hypothetical protein
MHVLICACDGGYNNCKVYLLMNNIKYVRFCWIGAASSVMPDTMFDLLDNQRNVLQSSAEVILRHQEHKCSLGSSFLLFRMWPLPHFCVVPLSHILLSQDLFHSSVNTTGARSCLFIFCVHIFVFNATSCLRPIWVALIFKFAATCFWASCLHLTYAPVFRKPRFSFAECELRTRWQSSYFIVSCEVVLSDGSDAGVVVAPCDRPPECRLTHRGCLNQLLTPNVETAVNKPS